YRCNGACRAYDSGCTAKTVPYVEINHWAWDQARRVLIDPDLIRRELERMGSEAADGRIERELAEARKRLAVVERQIKQAEARIIEVVNNNKLWSAVTRAIEAAEVQREAIQQGVTRLESELKSRPAAMADLTRIDVYSRKVSKVVDRLSDDD